MSVEENLKRIADLERVFNERDWGAFEARHAEDVVAYEPMSPEPVRGIEAHREGIVALVNAFPDARMKLERSFGQGDWVFADFTFTGTHEGPFKTPQGEEIPPTNRKVTLRSASAVRFEEGQIAEEHTYFDRLGLLEQLGLAGQGPSED